MGRKGSRALTSVLAIDAAETAGVAFFAKGELRESGLLNMRTGMEDSKRWVHLARQYPSSMVVIESNVFRGKGAAALGHHSRHWLYRAYNEGLDDSRVAYVSPNEWRSGLFGHGNANKQHAINYVAMNYGIEVTHDEAEAICIGRFALYRRVSYRRKLYDKL